MDRVIIDTLYLFLQVSDNLIELLFTLKMASLNILSEILTELYNYYAHAHIMRHILCYI